MIELLEVDSDAARLIGGYSPTSGHHHFPLAPVCPYTGADDVERVTLPAIRELVAGVIAEMTNAIKMKPAI